MSASTSGSGRGGSLIVEAPEAITISGPGQLAVATTGPGPAGNIDVTAPNVTLADGVTLAATSSGSGAAGNITFDVAENLTVDASNIIATTVADVDGGNLTLTLGETLLLRNGSTISTTAGTAQAGGNGGNITIDIPEGFIVAVPRENSDITANAFTGRGGRVTIEATQLFGIEPRPQLTPLSDITASSEQGNPGTIESTPLRCDASVRPPKPASNSRAEAITQGCQAGAPQATAFYITGDKASAPAQVNR